MKFYYNNKLVRTSKSHIYTHATMDGDKCLGCSGSKDGAEKIIKTAISYREEQILNFKNKIKAFENGEDRYSFKDGRKTYYMSVKIGCSKEECFENIKEINTGIEYIKANWKIVELEAR